MPFNPPQSNFGQPDPRQPNAHPYKAQSPAKLPAQSALQRPAAVPQGIYLLGDDGVLGALQTLFERLNHYFAQRHCALLPVCIIPSSDDLRLTRRWIAEQDSLSLFDNSASMDAWEAFAQQVWSAQPVVSRLSQRYSCAYGQTRSLRRFCAFDGEFETFVLCDARSQSTHGLDQLEEVLVQLQSYEVVVDDWEHLKAEPTALLDLSYASAALGWSEAQVRERLHGASFFGSHAGLIGAAEREKLLKQLLEGDEIRWLNPLCWWNDAALFSYMTLRSGVNGAGRSLYNFARPSRGVAPTLDPLTSELLAPELLSPERFGSERLGPEPFASGLAAGSLLSTC